MSRRAQPDRAFDPLLQHPARLQLLSLLATVTDAEFAVLRETLGVSDSVLSKHLSVLGDADYIAQRKGVHAGRRTTWVRLTRTGKRALGAHICALRSIIDAVPPMP